MGFQGRPWASDIPFNMCGNATGEAEGIQRSWVQNGVFYARKAGTFVQLELPDFTVKAAARVIRPLSTFGSITVDLDRPVLTFISLASPS